MGFQGGLYGFRGIPWCETYGFSDNPPGWNSSLYNIKEEPLLNTASCSAPATSPRAARRRRRNALKFYRGACDTRPLPSCSSCYARLRPPFGSTWALFGLLGAILGPSWAPFWPFVAAPPIISSPKIIPCICITPGQALYKFNNKHESAAFTALTPPFEVMHLPRLAASTRQRCATGLRSTLLCDWLA